MANTTVSRRLVYIKRRRQTPPKPRTPENARNDILREDDVMIGEPARPARPMQPRSVPPPPKPRHPWRNASAWFIALTLALVAIPAVVIKGTNIGRPQPEASRTPEQTMPSRPGRGGKSYGEYPGASGLLVAGQGTTASSTPTVEGFLAAPFKKRRTCVVQAGGGKESMVEFGKCLEN